ncbi:MAG: VanW family protein [Chitinophagales bacterium]
MFAVHVLLNTINNIVNGYWLYFAKRRNLDFVYTDKIVVQQELKPHPPKVHNIKIAIKIIEPIHILPNEIFSFSKIVGMPSKKKGFIPSRSIIGNKVEESIGGGICQVAGLIYYVSLIGNLEIIERYNHSMDIYNEETRFTPLGSDATVAYGYKDLKLKNTSKSPVNFKFQIDDKYLTIELNHCNELKKQKVEFRENSKNSKEIIIETVINGKINNISTYKKKQSKYNWKVIISIIISFT